jgi:hypothetical protein
MSALRGSDVVISNNTLGVLCLDIALRALCAYLEPFVVKKMLFYINWIFTPQTTMWNRKMRESNHIKPIQPQDPAPPQPNFIFPTYHSQIIIHHS